MRCLRGSLPLSLIVACGPEPPAVPAAAEVAVRTEPASALDAVPSVVHFRVTGLDLPPTAVLLFEGELSSYHDGRIRSADLPSTLAERFVPVTAFHDELEAS